MPAPPLALEVVPGGVVFVAGGAVLLVDEVFVGAVELLVLVLLEVLVEVLVVGVEEVVLVVVVRVQSLAASCATVLAPWLRFCERVVLTVEGRLVTALVNADAAPLA
jgi:hypothetical protein